MVIAAVVVAGLVLFQFFGPGSSASIFSGLHNRAYEFQANPPDGLSLVQQSDHGSTFCPLECGGAWTTVVYSGPEMDQAHLCDLGRAKLTDLFGPSTTGRAQPGGCAWDGSGQTWPMPGIYRDHASASLKVEPAGLYDLPGDGFVLVVVLNSGRG